MEDRSRRRARIFTILGLALAFFAAVGTYLYASSAQTTTAPPEEKGPVVVALRDLAARQAITAADIKIEQYPRTIIPPTAIADPEKAVGKVLTQPVARGEPLLDSKFIAQQGTTPFSIVPPGHEFNKDTSPHFRAMSISVGDPQAAGGNIQAGDFVDIIATISLDPAKWFTQTPPDPNRVTDFSTKIVLENVPILARQGGVYTIRIEELTIAEKLTYMQAAGGQLVMLLRAPKDDRLPTTRGVIFETLYRDFAFPSGRKFPPLQ